MCSHNDIPNRGNKYCVKCTVLIMYAKKIRIWDKPYSLRRTFNRNETCSYIFLFHKTEENNKVVTFM